MHHQFYDSEEESEPRVTPKPVLKLDHFAVPTVPEVSLIFERSKTESRNDGSTNLSSLRPLATKPFNDTVRTSVSPVWSDNESYAHWKEQNYRPAGTSTLHDSSSRRTAYKSSSYAPCSREQINRTDNKQKMLINRRINNGTPEKSVKFQCPNVNDSYNSEQRTRLSSTKGQISCISVQEATRNISDACCASGNPVIPDTLKQSEHLQVHGRCHPQVCLSGYSNYGVDNNETVKTLLQLVNSQSEQIKNLQLQIDRLVRMQEESFRNKSACACQHSPSLVANQLFGYPSMNYRDCPTVSGSSLVQYPSRDAKEDITPPQNTRPTMEKEDLMTVDEGKKLETIERQSKKAFMEQKVSIGVMTSFEFTVQNSPFLLDSEMYERKEVPRETNNARNMNVHDTPESTVRYKNTFARKSGTAQLENIVEDSESHLSSSQQQSSNFNASSVRDSDRHTPKQSDLYGAYSASESPRMYQHTAIPVGIDPNREKAHEEAYTGKSNDMDERLQNRVTKMSDASMNVDYSCAGSASYSKAPVVGDTDGYTTAMDEDESRMATGVCFSNRTFGAHSPENFDAYRDCYHKNKEHCVNVKETKDVGDSVILSGGDLRVVERPPPTPEPSIHVEMQEYTSDDESDRPKRTPKIGWTFYNNVLGQVNDILQNSSIINDKDINDAKVTRKAKQKNDVETKAALNTVKAATLEQLRRLGISLTENNENGESSDDNNKMLDFDSSIYPRLDRQANIMHTTSVVNETNTSMHMKALALKYLNDEQLADIALHKQESSSLKHLLLSNMEGNNMSFATMRYLERYQLLPGKNNGQLEDAGRMHGEIMPKMDVKDVKAAIGKNSPVLRQFPFVQTPATNCSNRVLDLSTLKRQPKLL